MDRLSFSDESAKSMAKAGLELTKQGLMLVAIVVLDTGGEKIDLMLPANENSFEDMKMIFSPLVKPGMEQRMMEFIKQRL